MYYFSLILTYLSKNIRHLPLGWTHLCSLKRWVIKILGTGYSSILKIIYLYGFFFFFKIKKKYRSDLQFFLSSKDMSYCVLWESTGCFSQQSLSRSAKLPTVTPTALKDGSSQINTGQPISQCKKVNA